MTKTFEVDDDGRISFTRDELKKLLDEVYNEGRADGKLHSYVYSTPSWQYTYWTSTPSSCTINGSQVTYSTATTNPSSLTYSTAAVTDVGSE